jgi:hypothetical protein
VLDEIFKARIYGGTACTEGAEIGRKVAALVMERLGK